MLLNNGATPQPTRRQLAQVVNIIKKYCLAAAADTFDEKRNCFQTEVSKSASLIGFLGQAWKRKTSFCRRLRCRHRHRHRRRRRRRRRRHLRRCRCVVAPEISPQMCFASGIVISEKYFVNVSNSWRRRRASKFKYSPFVLIPSFAVPTCHQLLLDVFDQLLSSFALLTP